jgi:hypothetical protein
MLNKINMKTCSPLLKLEHKMYGPYDKLDNMSTMVVGLHNPKVWQIYLVCHHSLTELFVQDNIDVMLYAIINISDPIENTHK